jgi:hypothetical protein
MSTFQTYLLLGLQHILNWQALDHLLFILAITCVYTLNDLKRMFYLVTAFTLGHSLTLALATLKFIDFSAEWIEWLIPCTILITAATNLGYKDRQKPRNTYWMVSAFGLIHGLGFSNYLQSLLGKEAGIVGPLFAFNVGLELGQLVIVSVILGLGSLLMHILHVRQRTYVLVTSGIIIGLVLPMILERW